MAEIAATERARIAVGEELGALLHHASSEVLIALLDNPAFGEENICTLLSRKTLPVEVIDEILQRRELLKSYAIKKSLACHPHTPRLAGLRLLRDLYLMDLVQIALIPGISVELRRLAEDQVAARLPQLPLGQKITLARRGPGRIAGLLLAEGHAKVAPIALDNVHINSAQILRALARENIPESVVQQIAGHGKWSSDYNVRLALIRNAASPLGTVLGFLPEITAGDLQELTAPGIVPERLRKYLEAEVHRRVSKAAARNPAEESRHERDSM